MLNITNLSFSYNDHRTLFNNLNLELAAGNIYGLLGKNGTGKTTLLKIICGLLFPKSGDCQVFGYAPKQRLTKFLEEVYFIPEEFFVPGITGKQYRELYGDFYPKFSDAVFNDCLTQFGIPDNKKLPTFSYGQKKKFLIAFGVATNCGLLVLDEPTNGLDIPSKSLFRKILASSITEDKTYIIATHQVRDMENLIDPIIILEDGRIIFNQTMAAISEHLTCEQLRSLPNNKEQLLYFEETPFGYNVVTKNTTGYESMISLEILFNVVVSKQAEISELFKTEAIKP